MTRKQENEMKKLAHGVRKILRNRFPNETIPYIKFEVLDSGCIKCVSHPRLVVHLEKTNVNLRRIVWEYTHNVKCTYIYGLSQVCGYNKCCNSEHIIVRRRSGFLNQPLTNEVLKVNFEDFNTYVDKCIDKCYDYYKNFMNKETFKFEFLTHLIQLNKTYKAKYPNIEGPCIGWLIYKSLNSFSYSQSYASITLQRHYKDKYVPTLEPIGLTYYKKLNKNFENVERQATLNLIQEDIISCLISAIQTLDARYQFILEQRFCYKIINGRFVTLQQEPMSLRYLSKRLNISPERVRQIEATAVEKLAFKLRHFNTQLKRKYRVQAPSKDKPAIYVEWEIKLDD